MERENDIVITIPASMGKVFLSYMEATHVKTIGEFFREAVNRDLTRKDEEKLTPASCAVDDNYAARTEGGKDGNIIITMQFSDSARVLLEDKGSENPEDYSWIVDSVYDYMEALAPALPRATLIENFSQNIGAPATYLH